MNTNGRIATQTAEGAEPDRMLEKAAKADPRKLVDLTGYSWEESIHRYKHMDTELANHSYLLVSPETLEIVAEVHVMRDVSPLLYTFRNGKYLTLTAAKMAAENAVRTGYSQTKDYGLY